MFLKFDWSVVHLQCCVSFWCIAKWFNCVCVCVYIYIYIFFFIVQQSESVYIYICVCVCSVQFSHSVVSNSLQLHGLHHTRPPCPSPMPGVYWNSCPLSRWCHPTISSSVIPFSSHLPFFPASGSFPMSQFLTSGGQSIGTSVSVLPMNIQGWFPLGRTGWISLLSKGFSRVFSNTTVQKHQCFRAQLFYSPVLTFIHDHWKNNSLD